MAFGRSNSLSLNTGATNSLFNDDELGAPPAFAAMPDHIANNGFNLSNTTNNMAASFFESTKSLPPVTSAALGAGLFGAPPPPPAAPSFGGIGNGGFFPSDPSKKEDPIEKLNRGVQEQRQQNQNQNQGQAPASDNSGQSGSAIGAGGFFPSSTPTTQVAGDDAAARLNQGIQDIRQQNQNQPPGDSGQAGQAFGNGLMLTNNSSQQQQSSQPATTSLFGSSTAQPANQTTGGSSLFGGNQQQQSQPQQTGGLFGSANPTPQTGGLFGGTNNQQQSQPQQSGGLFGGTSTQQSQPQQPGGLFASTNQQQNQSSSGGGLFGGNNAPQPNQSSGLGGLLGGGAAAQQSSSGGGLFGGANTQPARSSIFAGAGSGLGNSSALPTGSSIFPTPAQPGTASSFLQPPSGGSQPSLLGATQHSRLNQSAPFGRLSMGQSTAPSSTVGAVKVDTESLRSTTRFDDCIDPIKAQLEDIDKIIKQQEDYCRQIEAICPKHGEDIDSLAPDVEYVRSKVDDVEQALISDAQGVEAQRRNTDKDTKDLERCHRVITNLTLPQPYQYSGSVGVGSLGSMYGAQQRPQQTMTPAGEDPSNYDMDLIGNYFAPMAMELQKTVNDYAKTLTEIESHMRVMESSAINQAQQLAQQKNGMGGGQVNSEDTVRELADTLRGFEHSILGVASVVGECREGVNELVLGRLGGGNY